MESIYSLFLDALKAFFCWLLLKLWTVFFVLVSLLVALIPASVRSLIAPGVNFLWKFVQGFDDVFPIDFAFTMCGAWLSWKLGFNSIRMAFRILRG